jgi:hypothetical protein
MGRASFRRTLPTGKIQKFMLREDVRWLPPPRVTQLLEGVVRR